MIKNAIILVTTLMLVASLIELASVKSEFSIYRTTAEQTIKQHEQAVNGLIIENEKLASYQLICGGLEYDEQ